MTTRLNEVSFGFNQFCGPAVMSILTGKTTDECAAVIMEVTGRRQIDAVDTASIVSAFKKLGFIVDSLSLVKGSLYALLTRIAKEDGLYLVTIYGYKVGHIVAVEVKDKQIYFCDNHTRQPIPAASSARLMQSVTQCIKLTAPPPPTPEQIRAAKLAKLEGEEWKIKNRISAIDNQMELLRGEKEDLEGELLIIKGMIELMVNTGESHD